MIKNLKKFMFEIYPYIFLYIIWFTGPLLAAGLIQKYCNDNSLKLELISAVFIIISCIFNLIILTAIIIKHKKEIQETDKTSIDKLKVESVIDGYGKVTYIHPEYDPLEFIDKEEQ